LHFCGGTSFWKRFSKQWFVWSNRTIFYGFLPAICHAISNIRIQERERERGGGGRSMKIVFSYQFSSFFKGDRHKRGRESSFAGFYFQYTKKLLKA
jgi:hypothetical protein